MRILLVMIFQDILVLHREALKFFKQRCKGGIKWTLPNAKALPLNSNSHDSVEAVLPSHLERLRIKSPGSQGQLEAPSPAH